MIGKTACRVHGGKTPSGIASANWKHGRYAKYLPTRLLEQYQEGLKDDDLLALRDEISLVRSRLTDLLQRVDSKESGHLWKLLQKEANLFDKANREQRMEDASEHLTEIRRLIRVGLADWAIWDEVGSTLEMHRRLVESERKRLVDMQQLITYEDAMSLITFVGGLIKEHVSNENEIGAISAALAGFVVREPKLRTLPDS